MNEKDKKKKIVMSVVVAGLLLLSVLTAAMVGVSAEDVETESSTIDEENNEQLNELMEKLEAIKGDRDPTNPVDRLDVLDPELTEILSGSMDSEETRSSSSESILTDPHTIDQHNVEEVHDMGIYGDGVQVSLMDTGFDMAHPDLIGTHAVFEYDEDTMDEEMEIYDGYPIAFDPVSMADYAYDGEIGQDYPVWEEVAPGLTDNSWYVNTSYETETYEDGQGNIVADFTEKEENETYIMPDEVEDGDTIRFGLHPDDKLATWYGERPAVLLTQDEEGDWTNVYVDLLNDREFVEETGAWIDGDDPESEVITRDLNEDGIADVSGGMLYFVSDGDMPIPYSQHFRETMNTIINLYMGYPPGTIQMMFGVDAWEAFVGPEFHTTPGDGDMIALMGDFNSFGSYGAHGTWTASAVSGQGVTGVPEEMIIEENETSPFPPTPGGSGGLPRGLSPNATIIPMGRFFDYLPEDNPLGIAQLQVPVTYSSVFFTADGYTGDPTITSDSADIASSSFGRTIDENHGGFNFYERMFDYVGTQYTQNTLFINSQGNEGSGFGTVSAPSGAQGVLSVGATGNQMYRVDPWNMYDGGPNPWYGDVTGMTSTGPHSKGSHGPDIMTNGQFGYGADPVNQQLDKIGGFQGNNSWTLWSGTSLSAPNAAGIAALVFEAYEEAHGEAPDAQTLKNIIMQGARDINNSPHLQGPGDADALASVEIAQGTGLYSEDFQWRPGENPEMEEHVEHHVNMMEAGESQTDSLTLENWYEDDIDYDMSAFKSEKVNETQIELSSGTFGPHGDGRVPLLMIDETGVYELIYNETNDNWDLSDEPIADLEDPNADLLRFGTHTPYENQGPYDYSLTEFYNWEDVNENGSFDGFDERNRIGLTTTNMMLYQTEFGMEVPTSDYFTIHDAMERAEDGIVVQMNNIYPEFMFEPFDFTLNIEQYNQVEWDWIELDEPTGTIGEGETLEYDITANVPDETIKGIYGGKLMIEDVTNGRTHPIPITITVGEHTDLSEPMHFGAAEGVDEHGIYRNDRLFGSWEGGRTGDWRFYTFHLTEDITDRDVVLDIEFDDELSDMSAYLLGGAEHDLLELEAPFDVDPFSVPFGPEWDMQDRYGVNTLETHDETDIDRGDHIAFGREEPLESGTYMIAVQSHQISGHEPYQEFHGTLRTTNVRTHRDAGEVVGPNAIRFEGEVLSIPAEEDHVNASFRYRMIGEDDWNQTELETVEEPGDYNITVDGLDDGTYEWKAVTQWNPENTGLIGEPITLQDLSEKVTTYPAEEDVVYGDSLTIWAEMSEDFVGELVDCTVDLGGWFHQDAEIDVDFASVDVPVVLSEGEHTYEFYLEDEYGNEHTEVVTFEVDNSDPMLEVISPEGGVIELTYHWRVEVVGTTEPDIAYLELDGQDITHQVDPETGEFDVTWSATDDGLNVLPLIAEDEFGNTVTRNIYVLYLPEFQEMREDIEEIDSELEELSFELESLEEHLSTRIDYIEETMEDLEEDVDDIQAEMRELDIAVRMLEFKVEYMEDDIDALERELNALEGELRDMIEDLEDEFDEELDDLRADLESQIADLEETIEAYEEMLDDINDRIDDAETEISSLERAIDRVEDDQEDQDDDIAMARNLGIIGLILAILALVIAAVAMSKGKPAAEEPEEYEEEEMFEETEEPEEEDLFEEEPEEEELFEEESEEEDLFEEETEEEELFEEESEEEDLFEEETEEL